MNFEDLTPGWKALSVLGIIFAFICVGLLILVILMFETDLIPWPKVETPPEKEIEDEFGDFLQEFEFGTVAEEEESYHHPTNDLEGNPVKNLMHIEVIAD